MNPDPTLLTVLQAEIPLNRIKFVTVIYNVVKDLPYGEKEDLLADEDTITTAKEVYNVFAKEGFKVNLFELNEQTVEQLFDIKTDLFFNLCYGIGSIPKTEAEVARILEKTGKPFTGGTSRAITFTTDKVATKKKFIKYGIPTPHYQIVVSKNDPLNPKLNFPLIVKPKNEDCSLGIHNNAVVRNKEELQERLTYVLSTYREPLLVEEYIDGRELNITVIGNGREVRMLPVSEIVFGESYHFGKKWKIVDFEAKWITGSLNYQETTGVCPAQLEKDTLQNIEKLAIIAYKTCGCRDYARIDVRLSPKQTPYFLEINLNPGIGPADGAVRSARAGGLSYSAFLKEIARIAVSRY